MHLPNPYICNGGPWHGQELWLCSGHTAYINVTTYKRTVNLFETARIHWCGRYKLRTPMERAAVPCSGRTPRPVIDWEDKK